MVPEPVGDPLRRLRGLQIASLVLIWGGLGMVVAGVAVDPSAFTGGAASGPIAPVLMAGIGVLLSVLGLIGSAVRAVIVRRWLPEARYRGPSVGVLFALGLVAGVVLTLALGPDGVDALLGGSAAPGVTLVALTSFQIGLLIVIGIFVVGPRALAGVRLLAGGGLGRSILLGLGLGIPVWLATTLLLVLVSSALELVGISPDAGLAEEVAASLDPTVVLLAFVVIAPVAEELFFRGVVLTAWEREYGPRVALIGSAALFALAHISVVQALPIFALGLLLGVVYRRTGSLPASIALHAAFNGISVGITFLVRLGVVSLPA